MKTEIQPRADGGRNQARAARYGDTGRNRGPEPEKSEPQARMQILRARSRRLAPGIMRTSQQTSEYNRQGWSVVARSRDHIWMYIQSIGII